MHRQVSSAKFGSSPEVPMRREYLKMNRNKIQSGPVTQTISEAAYSLLKDVLCQKPNTLTFAKRFVEE
jgi:hypothetical protein